MIRRAFPWSLRVGALASIFLLDCATVLLGQEKGKAPAALPADLVVAWQRAGAFAGWTHIGTHGFPEFVSLEESSKPVGVPAFRFRIWQRDLVAKLAAPGSPFGLDVSEVEVTDGDLKDLARFQGNLLIALLELHGLTVRRQLEGKIDTRWRSLLSEDDIMQETYADALLGIRGFKPDGEDSFPR